MSQDYVGMADDMVVVTGDKGKVRNGQGDVMRIKDHRDVITIRDMLFENRRDVRVVGAPSMPQTVVLCKPPAAG